MSHSWKNTKTTSLFKAVLRLKTVSECEKFFRDLLTLEEIREFSERWQVAQMVDKGISYREIAKKTGVSTATITRVAHWLKHGEGGYKLILKRIKNKK